MDGPGRKLTENASNAGPSSSSGGFKRPEEQGQQNKAKKMNTTLQSMMQEERRKILEEMKKKEENEAKASSSSSSSQLVAKNDSKYADFESKQLFICPSINCVIPITINELINQMREYIRHNFGQDQVVTSAHVIRNCNLSSFDEDVKQQVDQSVDTLEKVLTNLLNDNLEEREKFKRLRKVKIEKKLSQIEGCVEFLTAIGFANDASGEWLVFQGDDTRINYYLDVLKNAQQFQIVLDRQACLLPSAQTAPTSDDQMQVDDDFFQVNPAEAQRELQERMAQRELAETLRTKAMREAQSNALNSRYKCRFTRLRFKLPNGNNLEGTFHVRETLHIVKQWLLQQLQSYNASIQDFKLFHGREALSSDNTTLSQLKLTPAAALIVWFAE